MNGKAVCLCLSVYLSLSKPYVCVCLSVSLFILHYPSATYGEGALDSSLCLSVGVCCLSVYVCCLSVCLLSVCLWMNNKLPYKLPTAVFRLGGTPPPTPRGQRSSKTTHLRKGPLPVPEKHPVKHSLLSSLLPLLPLNVRAVQGTITEERPGIDRWLVGRQRTLRTMTTLLLLLLPKSTEISPLRETSGAG